MNDSTMKQKTEDITTIKHNPHFSPKLLGWYHKNARVLPWRNNPNPYHVWLSEIMLQQTRVVAVLDYYRRFLEELPTIEQLASCPEEKLLKLWQGLGYYNRARNLQKAAIQIMEEHQGVFPTQYPDILNLSGVGEYTAGAIASSVYGLPHPAVDGNVYRVVSRFTGNTTDITTSPMKKFVTEFVMTQMPQDNIAPYNQALMELGATICLPNGEPLCQKCPVQEDCACGENDLWRNLPTKKSKKPRRIEQRDIYLIYVGEFVAIHQRKSKGLLASLWEFPQGLTSESPWQQWELPKNPKLQGTGTHIFSHIEWHMTAYALYYEEKPENFPKDWVLATEKDLQENYAIPSAFSFLQEFLWK